MNGLSARGKFKPGDVFPSLREGKRRPDPEEAMQARLAWVAQAGGEIR